MGGDYARLRNFDFGPGEREHVSCLSAHVRHRLVLERELAQSAVKAHGPQAAEKFIQEVFWRIYWKGWLEMRPAIWADYCAERDHALQALHGDHAARTAYQNAVEAQTGIACFDAWVQELQEYGYLHNHARMWFASIWIFTFKLPWALGADYFLRHLVDGDAASNTLSWRWVAGLQTQGKAYQARASNIAKFTNGRFEPEETRFAQNTDPLPWHAPPKPIMPALTTQRPSQPYTVFVHEEDCLPGMLEDSDLVSQAKQIVVQAAPAARGPGALGAAAQAFTAGALEDVSSRMSRQTHQPVQRLSLSAAAAQAQAEGDWVSLYCPTGPVRDVLGDGLHYIARAEDALLWPYATKGFFKFKDAIPSALDTLGIG
jgi:deoxyribodipyrimidine photo-lyase